MRLRAALALSLVVYVAACAADGPAHDGLVIAYIGVGDSAHADAWRGAMLGTEEVQHAAELIGRDVEVLTASVNTAADAAAAAIDLAERGASVIIGGFDAASCTALAQVAEERRLLYLNSGCGSDALRGRGDYTFHVQASDALRRSAVGGVPAERLESRVVWHGALGRYGAAQLNRRFRERFGADAGDDAWAAWMAMKIAWESAQQAQAADAPALRAHLLSDGAEFDGHKGQPLAFDPGTRQLMQPLFDAPAAGLATHDDAARQVSVDGADALRAAVAADRPLALVSNEGSSDVAVIDLRDATIIARFTLPARPRGIRSSPDGRHVYVALSDDAPSLESDADAIAVIDLAQARVVRMHAAGTDPEQFALSPDGARLYSANEDAGTTTISDLRSGEIIATLVVGIEPEGVAASPDGRWVYVTAETSNTVSVIDTDRNAIVASFLVGVRPRAAVFSPDGTRAYVTNEISSTLSVVDVAQHEVIATVELARGAAKPVGVVTAPDGSRIFVANGHAASVSVIDAATLRETALIPVGQRPWGLAIGRDGRTLYTANGGSGDVSVIDLATLRVTGTIPVGDRPWGLTLRP